MKWYIGIVLFLGCGILQASEIPLENENGVLTPLENENGVLKSTKDRLIEAIRSSDVFNFNIYLRSMKRTQTISSQDKKELLEIAEAELLKCRANTTLANSSSDFRRFSLWTAAATVTGVFSYILGRRCSKKSQSFVDHNNLRRQRDFETAKIYFTDEAARKNMGVIPQDKLAKLAGKAVEEGTFDWETKQNYKQEIRDRLSDAEMKWYNEPGIDPIKRKSDEYWEQAHVYHNRAADCFLSGVAMIGLGALSAFFCKKASYAYGCPDARQKTACAAEIKQSIELIKPVDDEVW